MRRLSCLVALAIGLWCAPIERAHAGFILEGSVGIGGQVSPHADALPFTIMITPGYGIIKNLLRFEVGIGGAFNDIKNAKFDLEFRPMLVLAPPIVPLYLKAVFAVGNVIHRPVVLAYGGALGVELVFLSHLSLFAELGVLPRKVENDRMGWVLEGRAGLGWQF